MANTKYYTVLLFVSSFSFVHSANDQLKWESISSVTTNQLVPAGKQGKFTYYVARGYVKNNWLNGKSLIMNGGGHVAYVPYNGKEAEGTDFQVLVSPSGTTSWVTRSGGNLPNYWIAGGTQPDKNETTFICRAFHTNHLIVGKGLKSSGNCYVGYRNLVYRYHAYEVLVLNDYGIATGAANVPMSPGPIFVNGQSSMSNPVYFKWPRAVVAGFEPE